MDKSARKIARKKASPPSRTARRPDRIQPRSGKRDAAPPVPRFSRITQDVVVTPPADFNASLILKEVAHDTSRRFAYWLLVGRYDQEFMSVKYRFTGESTLRCDIPDPEMLSAVALQPYLAEFLDGEGLEPDGPPVIIGKGQNK
jgi:hypothetical protein